MNLLPMLFATALLAILGWVAAREPQWRWLLVAAGALAFVMAMQRGYYWDIFGRGTGFFSANRSTAIIIFALALLGPVGLRLLKDRPLPPR